MSEKSRSIQDAAIANQEKIIYTGFIAQDVEKAAKNLNYIFSGVDAPKNDNDLYGLRYDEFVAPLVKAVQELNDSLMQSNTSLQSQIDELESRLQKIELLLSGQKLTTGNQPSTVNSNDVARLEQNIPNPFSSNTIIRYYIPEKTNNAQLIISDANGHVMKTIALFGKGNGLTTITSGTFSQGNYFYSLMIDGKKSDTKQMILSK
jgi:hypothetical protein